MRELAAIEAFIDRWSDSELAERSNKDMFLTELCDLLDLPHPDPAGPDSSENAYVFERAVPLYHSDGHRTIGKIDLYRRDRFVLEAKQTAACVRPENQTTAEEELDLGLRHDSAAKSDPYGKAMIEARTQAERYARNLPDSEPPPPFILVLDVGHSIEVFADFTQKGKAFLPFPDPRSHRILISDLRDGKIRERIRAIWLDPASLDPAKVSAAVTREAARHLAELAKSFETQGHPPRLVAAFLTRCLFCMFAEDVELLPRQSFQGLLESLRATPHGVAPKLEVLFRELNTGTPFSTVLNVRLLYFNGGLFADSSALPLNGTQLGLLINSAKLQWRDVEPAIFGTLLERALDPAERHKLGAHYTPRAYVERLVLPTVIEPLRSEWNNVLAAALSHAEAGQTAKAQEDIFTFHRRLCSVRVLDPACGSGNFLYVTLAHFKVLEAEVLDAYERFGGGRRAERGPRGIGAETVDPHQFLGIELNPRAAAIAELVLWIGYLQWHYRTFGSVAPAEPVLRNFRNIENRDAVLGYDGTPEIVTWKFAAESPNGIPGLPPELADDSARLEAESRRNPLAPVTLWDRRSYKVDMSTGRDVPDESKRVPLYFYRNPRSAEWPECEFVVGNPPFLGSKMVRDALGEGYTATLRAIYSALPETADFVMYWWHKAAELCEHYRLRRFGFITTNSLRQASSRRIVQMHVGQVANPKAPSSGGSLAIRFAIPDHPWVDTAEGAAVRIAMTVGSRADADRIGELVRVVDEGSAAGTEGEVVVRLVRTRGVISADLSTGADVAGAKPLRANTELAFMGAKLVGDGFVVTAEQACALGRGSVPGLDAHIKPYLNGRDLTERPRGVYVIDLFGLSENEVRERFPRVFEHLLATVKPQRNLNKRASYREQWWIFAEPRARFRASVRGLRRYIVTSEVGKHRFFVTVDPKVFPDGALIAFTLEDPFFLGVLSSRAHVVYSLTAGGTLEDRPRYQPSVCFDPFPFPACGESTRQRIGAIAEELDAHRKRAQERHSIGLTAMYNVLERLRAGQPLDDKEHAIHDLGLVSTLKHLHEQLDVAVAEAYGWPWPIPDAEILTRLVALNAARSAEEARGTVRWLRPDFQAPAQTGLALPTGKRKRKIESRTRAPRKSRAKPRWPKSRPEQVEAVASALITQGKPATARDLAAVFSRANAKVVAEILSALVTLGRAHRGITRGTFVP